MTDLERLVAALAEGVQQGRIIGLAAATIEADGGGGQTVTGAAADNIVQLLGGVALLQRDLLNQADEIRKGEI